MRESIVQLVFFVAVVAVAGLFVGTMVTQTGTFAQSVESEGDRSAAEIDAEIAIVNDDAVDAHDADDGTTTLYVKNVGGSTLDPGGLDVVLDGEYVDPVDASVLDGDRWRVGSVLEVRVDAALDPGDRRVLLRIRGAEDRLTFEHRIAFWEDPENATCEDGVCTVGNETVDLEMATDPAQEGEPVDFAVNDTSTATVDPGDAETGSDGTAGTTLTFAAEGTVTVTLDVGWDTDEIVVRYEDGG